MEKIKTWLKNNRKIIIIFLIAFIPRLIFMLASYFIQGDYSFREGQDGYLDAGLNLLLHGVFTGESNFPLTPHSFPAPGYPVLLAVSWLIIPKYVFVVFWQNIMFSIFIVYIYKFSRLFFNDFISFAAAIFTALEPFSILWPNVVMSETPFLLFFMLSLYFLALFWKEEKWKFIIYSAVLLGLAALIRPIVTYFYPVIFISSVIMSWPKITQPKLVKFLLVYLIVFLAVISSWSVRNKIQFNDYAISTLPNYLYFLTAARDFLILSQGMSEIEADNYLQNLAIEKAGVENFNQILMKDKYIPVLKEITQSLIKADLSGYFKWHLIKSIPVLTDSGWMEILVFWHIKADKAQKVNISNLIIQRDFSALASAMKDNRIFLIRIIGVGFWLFIDFIAFLGIIFMFLRKELLKISLVMLLIIGYFVFASSWAALARLRLPFQPFLFLFFFYGLYWLYNKYLIKEKQSIL
ncbi:MAG: hypothetical protein A3I20_02340 [Candidatus Portnoybacteria bacterium RIFCSPLOWO2_02_FULL_40_15]|nr:MAG: hypothetical protein A3I20_02340 [Candidatus Portnoybacteria bacterium RIFCSPLOWO2_02_FULL_40_15]